MRISLHDIFVFHDGRDVRLCNHSAINFCHVLTEGPEPVWFQLIIFHAFVCCWGRRISKLQFMATQGKHRRSWQSRRKSTKNSDMLDFHWGIPDATSLFFDYVTLLDLPVVPNVHIRTWRWKFVSQNKIMPKSGWICVLWSCQDLTKNLRFSLFFYSSCLILQLYVCFFALPV